MTEDKELLIFDESVEIKGVCVDSLTSEEFAEIIMNEVRGLQTET